MPEYDHEEKSLFLRTAAPSCHPKSSESVGSSPGLSTGPGGLCQPLTPNPCVAHPPFCHHHVGAGGLDCASGKQERPNSVGYSDLKPTI